MSDVFQFRLTRPAQRAVPTDDIVEAVPGRSVLVGSIKSAIAGASNPDSALAAAQQDGQDFVDGNDFVQPGSLEGDRRIGADATLLDHLVHLDHWLAERGNEPMPDELEKELLPTLKASAAGSGNRPQRSADWNQFRMRLGESLVAATAAGLPIADRARLLRMIVLAALVERRATQADAITVAEIRQLLRHRPVALPRPPFPLWEAAGLSRRALLAREPAFSDLYVVRKEWSCYQPGEVSHIENVLMGETKVRTHKRLDETETTAVTETEHFVSEVHESQSTDRSELTEEVQQETSVTIGLEGQVDTSGRYGPTQVDTHLGASLDYSVSDSKKRATQQSQEVIARAAQRIETRVKQARTVRSLTTIEELNSHTLDNLKGTAHVRGVYRWVDKIERLQLFRFPNRYLLEFQVPEPGAFFRYRWEQQPGTLSVEKPPAAPPDASTITPTNYQALVAQYRAASLPSPPDPELGVAMSIGIEPKTEIPMTSSNLYNAPIGVKTENAVIPPGYGATEVAIDVLGTPVRAVYRRENEATPTFDDMEGFHRIQIDVLTGEHKLGSSVGGANAVNASGGQNTQHGGAFLTFETNAGLSLKLVDKVPVTVVSTGAGRAAVNVRFKCVPLDETVAAWRNSVYDGIQSAWLNWKRRYDEALQAEGPPDAMPSIHPARAAEIVQDELKRQTIELLLGVRFQGRDALAPGVEPPETDLVRAPQVAAEIQFLEQAFEWQNLTFALYPFFWTAQSRWADIADIDGADPDFARFLRSGSARVVVPARPGFEEAVDHFIVFGEPWEGGPAPVPNSPSYISVAREIQDILQATTAGEPGESWEVRLPTTLLWLDDTPTLPQNEHRQLGKAGFAPLDPLCVANP